MISDNFIDAIRPILQDEQSIEAYKQAAQRPLKKSLKIINSRVRDNDNYDNIADDFLQLTPWDWTLSATVFAELKDQFYIDRETIDIALGKTRQHLCGFFYLQEVAASLPANFLDIPEGGIVLDVCAAPGGKTVQLADRLLSKNPNKPGLVWWNDIDRKRIQTWWTNINRTSMYNTMITQMDGSAFGNLLPEFFDAILVDAPCSGEGTWFKSDSALKWWKEESINKIAATQEHILTAAIKATKVWGSIVYSTCTLNHIENEWILTKLLQKYPDSLELEEVALAQKSEWITHYEDQALLTTHDAQKCARCRPHIHKTGGFFVSKIRKKAAVTTGSYDKKDKAAKKYSGRGAMQYMTYEHSKKLTKEVRNYFADQFGITLDEERFAFAASKHKVYCVSPAILPILNTLPIQKIGVPILKKTRDWFRPLHNAGLLFAHLANKNTATISAEDLQEYVVHKDIPAANLTNMTLVEGNTYCMLVHKNKGVSVAKRVGDNIKNKFLKR